MIILIGLIITIIIYIIGFLNNKIVKYIIIYIKKEKERNGKYFTLENIEDVAVVSWITIVVIEILIIIQLCVWLK